MKKAKTFILACSALALFSGAFAEEKNEKKTEEKPKTEIKEVTKPGEVPKGYNALPALSEKPKRKYKTEPKYDLKKGQDLYALIDTNKGQILIDLYEQSVPMTVSNFVHLSRNRFYDGLRWHRVIDGFMAQGGDPNSADESKKATWGQGGPGYQFADEFRTKLTFDGPGVLAMANSGPATNGSQFFITFGPTQHLNGRHTIFGKVVKGKEILDNLNRTEGEKGKGKSADTMLSIRILTKS